MIQRGTPRPSATKKRMPTTVAISAVVLMAAVAIWETYCLFESERRSDETQAAVASVDRFQLDLLNAETGQRGYMISQDETFLEPLRYALDHVTEHLRILRLRFDEELYSGQLDQIEELTRAKLGELRSTLEYTREGRWEEGRQLVARGDGKKIMDELRVKLTELRSAEEARMDRRQTTIQWQGRAALVATILTAIIGIAVSLVSAKRLQGEAAVREQTLQEVEAAVEKRTQELREALSELEKSNAAKTDFLAIMSHEMRTPLNTILGYAQLLGEDLTPQAREEYLEAIRAGGSALLGVINEVLDFAAIESGKLTVHAEPIDFRRMIRRIVIAMRPPHRSERLIPEIESGIPALILGDEDKLRQVIINLVANALKFAPEGNVTLRCSAPEGRLQVEVIDNGIGIAAEALSRIFDAFTQAESSTKRRFGGTGLGLAICKRFVEAMGGEISAESTPGKGSHFTFWIPLRLAPSNAMVELDADPQLFEQAKTLRCLVVEDNNVNRRLMVTMLEKSGVRASGAANGVECLRAIREHEYDVVFMDLEMPEMDGYETTREIRRLEKATGSRRLAIFALTGDVVTGVQERCFAAGMDRYLSKPVKVTELLQALQMAAHDQSSRFEAAEAGVVVG